MIPLKTFVLERRAANLLARIRWRDGVYCPRCRPNLEWSAPPLHVHRFSSRSNDACVGRLYGLRVPVSRVNAQTLCRPLVIRYGSYRVFQRYRCKNCDRTFNYQTGTAFEHSAVNLRKWFLAVYTYIGFNTSFRQLDVELGVSYKTVYRRVHNSKGRLKSTNCTSKPRRKAASATRGIRAVTPLTRLLSHTDQST